MIFDKLKEMLSGSLAESIPGADALTGITEQFGSVEEATTALGETPISEAATGLTENLDSINPFAK